MMILLKPHVHNAEIWLFNKYKIQVNSQENIKIRDLQKSEFYIPDGTHFRLEKDKINYLMATIKKSYFLKRHDLNVLFFEGCFLKV